MYWMSGERLAEAPTAAELARFLAVPADVLSPYLDRFAAERYLDRTPDGYRMTSKGEALGKRSFADEFAGLTGQAHGECDDDCWCHESRPAVSRSGSSMRIERAVPKNFLRPCLLLLLRAGARLRAARTAPAARVCGRRSGWPLPDTARTRAGRARPLVMGTLYERARAADLRADTGRNRGAPPPRALARRGPRGPRQVPEPLPGVRRARHGRAGAALKVAAAGLPAAVGAPHTY